MKPTLSANEQKILAYIADYIKNNGESPTLEEIAKRFDFGSLTSVQRAIVSLEEKNRITRDKFQKRNISLVVEEDNRTYPVPIVGVVACGAPILAVENIEGYLPTDAQLLRGKPEDYFYLKASGDSMDKANINDGDLVLIRQQTSPAPGERVVALIDDHATIKKLQFGDGYIALIPESTNPDHKPIVLRKDFSIQGVVVKSFQL